MSLEELSRDSPNERTEHWLTSPLSRLRLHIWKLTLPEPRVLRLITRSHGLGSGPVRYTYKQQSDPSTDRQSREHQTCRESWMVFKENYEKITVQGTIGQMTPTMRLASTDFRTDTIVLSLKTLLELDASK
jgi:hypothetical protein